MFKNYHIVIFKDREAGFKNLRFRGWFGMVLFLVVCALAGINIYLWNFYSRAFLLERELVETQRAARDSEAQILSLAGKIQDLETDLARVRQFNAKLRVLMNIDSSASSQEEEPPSGQTLANPVFLSQHRELFSRRLHRLVDDLANSVHMEEVEQESLLAFLRENKDILLSTPSIWPAKGYLTSGFGYRTNPFTGRSSMHQGIDISNQIGTPVWAPARGRVTFAGPDGAYGISVIIDHGNDLVTRYSHLQQTLVKVGQSVQRGEVIASLGNTGRSTGPHLHYEIIVKGAPVNPLRYILN
ncbi:MAG: peptidoglycan DD-metalloendopeptidase family protein [Desulfovibrio sp.]|nr:peptidoglycan DD-metalloendopeptidase family protein [Desulfovibrio sp.]